MKVECISNSQVFGSKINNTKTIQKGFDHAKQYVDKNPKEVQNFVENLKIILKDKKQKCVSFSTTPCIATVTENNSKQKFIIANHPFNEDAEGLMCLEGINRYASKINPFKNVTDRKFDINALKEELRKLEELILKTN